MDARWGPTDFHRFECLAVQDLLDELQKAFKNYQYSSSLNYPLAHAKLAYFYENGIFTKVDKEAAISLYQKSLQKWAKKRLLKLVTHDRCLTKATTRLFSVQISCANRTLLRDKIKQEQVKVISEDDESFSDTYFTAAMTKGSSELTIRYTEDNEFSQATYTFVGRNNPALIITVKNKLIEAYGLPNYSQGNQLEGEASFQWILKDNIILRAYRMWPDTTTFVEYTQAEHVQ